MLEHPQARKGIQWIADSCVDLSGQDLLPISLTHLLSVFLPTHFILPSYHYSRLTPRFVVFAQGYRLIPTRCQTVSQHGIHACCSSYGPCKVCYPWTHFALGCYHINIGPTRSLYTGEFADFKIVCEPYEFKAHKLVLCAESKYFHRLCTGSFRASQNYSTRVHGPTDPITGGYRKHREAG
jgi:BTB/POZ domain